MPPTLFTISLGDGDRHCRSLACDDIRLIAAIGFWAAKSGCVALALRIFESLVKLRPNASFPYIGLSIAYMAAGMNPDAVRVLSERAADARIDDDALWLWRSLAFFRAGSRTLAADSLKKYLSVPSSDGLSALADKLTKEIGLRPSIPDWPLPAVVSDQEAAF